VHDQLHISAAFIQKETVPHIKQIGNFMAGVESLRFDLWD
jgi:hypothetical protein